MFVPDAAQMLINISQTMPQLMRFVTALGYVYGTYLIVTNVAGLRNCAHIGHPSHGQHTVIDLLKKIFLGAMLIYLPDTIQVGTSTFWTNTAPFAYVVDGDEPFSELITAVYSIIYLVGTIAIIRGILELAGGC